MEEKITTRLFDLKVGGTLKVIIDDLELSIHCKSYDDVTKIAQICCEWPSSITHLLNFSLKIGETLKSTDIKTENQGKCLYLALTQMFLVFGLIEQKSKSRLVLGISAPKRIKIEKNIRNNNRKI